LGCLDKTGGISQKKKRAGILGSGPKLLQLVAGDRNVLKIPRIPFRFELQRPSVA
jgi:hypothetical protein